VDLSRAPKIFRDIWALCLEQDKDGFLKCGVNYDPAEKRIVICRNLRGYKVYGRLMNGEYSEETEDVQAPGAGGIRITVSLRDNEYSGSAKLPQTVQKPYWKQYTNALNSTDRKHHLMLSIEYGHKRQEDAVAVAKRLAELASKSFGDEH